MQILLEGEQVEIGKEKRVALFYFYLGVPCSVCFMYKGDLPIIKIGVFSSFKNSYHAAIRTPPLMGLLGNTSSKFTLDA